MAKKRTRHQNPEPFLADDTKSVSTKRSKPAKQHQHGDKRISAEMTSKILKVAQIQQEEIEKEETEAQNPNNLVFVEEPVTETQLDNEEDIDAFNGFSETQSQFGDYEDEIDEEEEKLLEAFFAKDAKPQRTLGDIIVNKIKERDQISSDMPALPRFDNAIIELYKSVGEVLHKYTSGKLPLAFKHIKDNKYWEEAMNLTHPEKWSANAMYQATRIFASNMKVKKVERFYRFVLLPRVREDIRKNKRLHFALYQALKKSLYKPAAFNKGILFPLCEARNCTLREAVIIGSILQKVSIPPLHSSVAILKLAEMEYCGTTSYFIKLLVEKKYALPYRVLDALVSHFMRFKDDSRTMPVIWHQSLLAFVQRYKNELMKDQKDELYSLVKQQRHKLVTPEICRELTNSRNRGEKEDDTMSISSNKPIEEDRFDIPDVPMEED